MRPRTASAPTLKEARFSAIQSGATWLSASVVRITPSHSPPATSQASAMSIAARRAAPACAVAGANRASTTRTSSGRSPPSFRARLALRSVQLLANTTTRISVGGIGRPNRSSCRASARKQAGRRSSSSFTGIATTKPGRIGGTSFDCGQGRRTAPMPTGSLNIYVPKWVERSAPPGGPDEEQISRDEVPEPRVFVEFGA